MSFDEPFDWRKVCTSPVALASAPLTFDDLRAVMAQFPPPPPRPVVYATKAGIGALWACTRDAPPHLRDEFDRVAGMPVHEVESMDVAWFRACAAANDGKPAFAFDGRELREARPKGKGS